MESILMAIRPPFSGLILEGKKTAEIRKTRPMFNPFTERRPRGRCACTSTRPAPAAVPVRVYIYETRAGGGAGAIVGRFDCPEFRQIIGPVTEADAAPACLTVEDMEAYRHGVALYAWQAVNPRRYLKPVPLAAMGARRPPQSWQWLNAEEIDALKGREKNNVLSSGRL